jgi:hypothetical protein
MVAWYHLCFWAVMWSKSFEKWIRLLWISKFESSIPGVSDVSVPFGKEAMLIAMSHMRYGMQLLVTMILLRWVWPLMLLASEG